MENEELKEQTKGLEQRIGKSRHIEFKIFCEYCGAEKWAKLTRIKIGQGRFCSLKCSNLAQKQGKNKKYVGKENGKTSLDKKRNSYYVFWFDSETLKRKNTSYARWYWEVNRGEIPEGYRASYKDGNSLNIEPDNIILISPEEFGMSISNRLMGHKHSEETKQKISMRHTGNKDWNGYATKSNYPTFSKHLKEKIRQRDEHKCRICKKEIKNPRLGRVHHIDGDKLHSVPENLIYVCLNCHSLIHSRQDTYDEILSFRSMLL